MVKEVVFYDLWSLEDAINNPKTLFIFGVNLLKVGNGCQAYIRPAKNSHGIPTKRRPSMEYPGAFFTDDTYKENKMHILNAFKNIPLDKYDKIALPSNGLGTGLAKMPEYCPNTFKFLNRCIDTLVKYIERDID